MPGSSSPHAGTTVTGIIAQTITSKLGRSTISAAISLAILAVAGFTLYQLLHDADFGKVASALKSQPLDRIAIAGAFVVAGYITLTFYDFFALHTIGRRKVPYAVAALASFTSFTIGHSLGAAVLTGGLIRLRIYSAWGLTVVDVAKIALVTGMTFWLGNALLFGGATMYAPEAATAVDHLPSSINRAIGLSGLVAIGCYLVWLAPRSRAIGRAGWRIVLPNLRLSLVQIGIGALDLALVTFAMYTLLPSDPIGRVLDHTGRLPHRDIAWNREPRAWRPRRDRSDDAHRPSAISTRGTPGGAADVPRALLRSASPGRYADTRRARIVDDRVARRRTRTTMHNASTARNLVTPNCPR